MLLRCLFQERTWCLLLSFFLEVSSLFAGKSHPSQGNLTEQGRGTKIHPFQPIAGHSFRWDAWTRVPRQVGQGMVSFAPSIFLSFPFTWVNNLHHKLHLIICFLRTKPVKLIFRRISKVFVRPSTQLQQFMVLQSSIRIVRCDEDCRLCNILTHGL